MDDAISQISRLNELLDPSNDQRNRRKVEQKLSYYKNKVAMYEAKLKRQAEGNNDEGISVSALSSGEQTTGGPRQPKSPLARLSNLKLGPRPEKKEEGGKTVNFL